MLKKLFVGLVLIGAGYVSLTGQDINTPAGISVSKDDNIANYRQDDAGINAAKAKGRATLDRFLQLIEAGTQGTYTFKTGLPYGDNNHEHVWVELSKIEDNVFKGRIANEPVNATQYKLGDPVTVSRENVSDWMIMSDTAIYGGYTMRHALSNLPEEQANQIKALLKD